MYIIKRTVVGQVEREPKGRDWRAVVLEQIATHIEGLGVDDGRSPQYFEATWHDGTKLDLSIEPERPSSEYAPPYD